MPVVWEGSSDSDGSDFFRRCALRIALSVPRLVYGHLVLVSPLFFS
jgi:hypothetical protein